MGLVLCALHVMLLYIVLGMYTLRCVLDYIRLNDVTECICDIEPVEWENLPNLPVDDHDIDVDYLLTKTLWLQVMVSLSLAVNLKSLVFCFH